MASCAAREKGLVLRIILNELATVSHKWFKIGIQLGLPRHMLKQFEKEDDPLSAVIDYWLNGNADPDVSISWSSIVAALRTKSVAEPGLAAEISEEHFPPQECTVKPDQPPSGIQNKKLDSEVEMDLKFILEKNLKSILLKYSAYMDCIQTLVKGKGISPEELHSYILSLPAFSSTNNEQRLTLMSDRKSGLEKANTVTEIFNFLNTECSSFLNFDIFQTILNKYNIKEDDREELKYPEHLKAYIEKHKISEFIKINSVLKKRMDGSEKLILKYNIEHTCKLAKIVELKSSIAEILDLTPSALDIVDIEDGCIVVTFLISATVADALFTPDIVFSPKQGDELQAASILWLECNGRAFNLEGGKLLEVKDTEMPDYVKMKMDQLVTCSVCLGTYTEPKLLHCLHTFCLQCLEGLLQQNQQEHPSLLCPTCRQVTPVPTSGVADLQVDFRVNQLLELISKDWKKVKTGSFVKSTSEDVESTSKDLAIVLHCPQHSKSVLAIFCETCGETICLKCIKKGEKHNDHDWEELDEAIERCKSQEIPASMEIIKEALADLDARCEEISNQRAAIEADIHEAEIIDLEKTELIGHLHELTQVKLKSLAAQKDQLETTQVQVNKHLLFLGAQTVAQKKSTSLGSVKELVAALQPDMLKPNTEADLIFSASAGSYGQILTMNLPDPSKCYATGEAIEKAVVGEKTTAIVQILGFNNQPCQEESINSITCELMSELTDSKATGIVEMREQSQYYITYKPTMEGNHQLHIKIRGQHIRGSPFSVAVEDPIQPMKRPRGVVITKKYGRKATEVDGWKIPQSLIVSASDLELGSTLGQGEFGVVYKGCIKTRVINDTVAVKTLKGSVQDELIRECWMMHQFDHPNVMKLSGICMNGASPPYLIMPFMANGNLKDYLTKELRNLLLDPKSTSPLYAVIALIGKIMLNMCFQVAKGMKYISSKRVIHRDLAARNCMVDVNFKIKISDFGLAVSLDSSKEYFKLDVEDNFTKLPIKWSALESIRDGVFSEKSDVWSFGVTCWEIFSGATSPYPDIHAAAIPYHLEKGQRLKRPLSAACSDEIYSLMMKCWNSEANLRPSFYELVEEMAELLQNVQQLKYPQQSEYLQQLKDSSEITLFSNISYVVSNINRKWKSTIR